MHQRTIDDDLNHIEDLYRRMRRATSELCVLWVTPEQMGRANKDSDTAIQLRPIVDQPSLMPRTP